MVMRRKEYITLIKFQVVVECLDRFQIEVVSWCIKNQAVGISELHTCNHTTHLLTPRKDICLLQHFFSAEQHTSQETLHIHFITFTKLAQPIYQVQVIFKEFGIVYRQISCSNSYTPRECTCICLTVFVDNFEESSHRTRITAQEYNLVTLFHIEAYITEQNFAIIGCCTQARYFKDLITRFTFRSKDYARILT